MYTAASAAQSRPTSNASFLHQPDSLRRRLPASSPSRPDSVLFNPPPNSRPGADVKGKGRAVPDANGDADLLAVDLNAVEGGMANGDGNPFQQMQLVEQQVRTSSLLSQSSYSHSHSYSL